MPGWLWVVVAVGLGVVIFLLLRTRGGNGRQRRPAVEYVPPMSGEAGEATIDVAERAAVQEELTPEWAHGAASEEEQEEDAELRHDEGYVETLSNDRPDPTDPTDPSDPNDPTEEPAEPVPAAERQEAGYGSGSAVSRRGRPGPEGWTIKGNADSLLFYTEDAPGYGRATADVWFESEDAATAAGFTRWDAHHR